MPRLCASLLLAPCLVLALSRPGGGEPPGLESREAPKPARPARTDRHGDPLPPGALARLGTTRLRHGAWVFCGAFAPDGRTLATGGDDNAVRLWDVATGREVWHYRGQERNVYTVAFSPDGKSIASGSADGTVHVLGAGTGRVIVRLRGNEGRVTAVAFSPDGKVLVSGSGYAKTCTISFWDVATGEELRRLRDAEGTEFHVAFAPDGKTLASSRAGRTLLWDVPTGQVLRDLTSGKETWGLAFAPDGKTLATADADQVVRLWDVATGRETRRLRGEGGQVAFAPDGKALVADGGDHALRLWDVATGRRVRAFDKDTSFFQFVAVSPDGRTLASACPGNRVRLWDVMTGKQTRLFAGHQDALTALAFCPDGRKLITGGLDNVIRVWDARTGEEVGRFEEEGDNASPLAVSPGGKILASGGPAKAIRLRDLTTGREVGRLGRDETRFVGYDPSGCLAFSPDGKVLASCDAWKTCLWDVAGGNELRPVEVSGHSRAFVFSGDGKVLAALEGGPATCEWRIHLRDAATGRSLRHFGPGAPPDIDSPLPVVDSIAVSPDFRLLATAGRHPAGEPQPVRVWDLGTGRELFALEALPEATQCLAFSPDGKVLASGGTEGNVSLWEVGTGRIRRRLPGHRGRVRSLAFAPDGATLASGGDDSTALVWDLTGPVRDGRPAADLERLWADLAGADAGRADEAIRDLIAAPSDAVPFLKGRLRPTPAAAGQRVRRLLTQLDSDDFAERQAAAAQLAALRDVAEPALREALAAQPTPEVRRRLGQLLEEWDGRLASAELVRAVRALEVLEHLNSPEACRLLEALAEGAPEVRLTREAKGSLERLAKRAAARP